jgi:predicted dehydrogenase
MGRFNAFPAPERPSRILALPAVTRYTPGQSLIPPFEDIAMTAPVSSTRRDFLRTAAAGAAGALAACRGPASGLSAASHARVPGANDRVRVGVVGFSDRVQSLLEAFQANAADTNFELVALSDIWSLRREDGAAFIAKLAGKAPALCRNNDELYDRKDVDAVIVATADFQHALHGVEAVRAGRDAYIEKPLANTMADARAILRAVEETGRVVQIGTQRRSGANYIAANDFIRSGKFGDPVMVNISWNVNQPGRWRRPAVVAKLREQDTDWKRFLMNRPFEPFDARKHLEFRLFWPYSSGIPCQWMVHQIDTVHWFTGLPRPRSVAANGGIYQWKDGRRNFDTMTAVFDYGPLDDPAKGFQVIYSSRMTNSAGGTKEVFHSNGGTLDLDTARVTPDGGLDKGAAEAMGLKENRLPEQSLLDKVEKVEIAARTGGDDLTSRHMRNWMDCVRSRKTPNAGIQAGYSHSVALCMTIAALHTGKRVTFDDAKQDVVIG